MMSPPSGTFAGKVAVVTGASRGIGAATAKALAAEGASVALAARSEDRLRELADEIWVMGGRAIAVPTDVGDADAIRDLVGATVGEFGRLDIAVNNAAGGGEGLGADVRVDGRGERSRSGVVPDQLEDIELHPQEVHPRGAARGSSLREAIGTWSRP